MQAGFSQAIVVGVVSSVAKFADKSGKPVHRVKVLGLGAEYDFSSRAPFPAGVEQGAEVECLCDLQPVHVPNGQYVNVFLRPSLREISLAPQG